MTRQRTVRLAGLVAVVVLLGGALAVVLAATAASSGNRHLDPHSESVAPPGGAAREQLVAAEVPDAIRAGTGDQAAEQSMSVPGMAVLALAVAGSSAVVARAVLALRRPARRSREVRAGGSRGASRYRDDVVVWADPA